MDSIAVSHSHQFTASKASLGKSVFQARVTEKFGNQYAIDTVMDREPLCGILFSSKPSTLPIPFSSSSRTRTYEIRVMVCQTVIVSVCHGAPRSIQPDSAADRQADAMHGEEASPQEPHGEPAGPVPVSDVLQPLDGSDLDKEPANQESSLQASMNTKDDQMDEAPNLNVEVATERVSPSTKD